MKIIELNHYLGGGGASRFMTDLSNQYAKDSSNAIIVITTNESSTPENDYISFKDDLDSRVHYITLGAKTGLSFKSIWGVFNLIRTEKPDVVHNHCNILLLLLPALLCSKVRYVHTIHTLVTHNYPGAIKRRVADWLYKSGRVQPVTISKECHDSYKEFFCRQEDVMITNGRCALRTTEKLSDVKDELSALGVCDNIPTFLHVARHHPAKNHDRLFSTFERLSNEGMDYHLIVIGDHYDECVNRIKDKKHIHLIGPRTNIGDYMSFADFFVLSSDQEGLPLVLLEAMSMGVVPICTPAGGIKDVLRNGENGYIGRDLTDEAFYTAIKQALSEQGKILANSIIQEYKEKYSMEVCAGKYMEVYRGYK